MAMKAIIEPTTSEVTQSISIGQNIILTVSSGNLTGAETVTFQLNEEGVGLLGNLYQDGGLRQLTATHNAMRIPGPIDLKVTKSVTSAPVGVYVKG